MARGTRGTFRGVANATAMQMIGLAFICALAVATLAPAPARNEDGLLMSLLGTVFLATIVMGVLALLDVLTGTAILAAIGASIMVPCAWLARAPAADFDEDEEDDDGGGSSPYEPSPRDGPYDWRPEPMPARSLAMSPQAPMIGPALAPAGPRAELAPPADVPASAAPAARPLNPRFPLIVTEPWTEPRPPVVRTPPADLPPEPVLAPEPPLRSRPQRGDHRSIVHRRAEGQHEGRRRRGVMRLRLLHGWRRRRRWTGAGDAPR
jgi:hypothetical protein